MDLRIATLVVTLLASTFFVSSDASADPDFDRQFAELSSSIDRSPTSADLRRARARLLLRYDRPQEALRDLSILEGLAPRDPLLTLLRARAQIALAQFERAESNLDAFLLGTPASGLGFALRARIRANDGRLADAIRDYDDALLLEDNLDYYLERGALSERLGDLSAACDGYRAGIQAHGGAVLLRDALARVELSRGHPEAALQELNQIVASARIATEWHLRRAEALDAMSRPRQALRAREQALADAERMMARRPSARALLLRASTLILLERQTDALNDLEQAVRRSPQSREVRLLRDQVRRQVQSASRNTHASRGNQ